MKLFEDETVVLYYTVPKGTEDQEVWRVARNIIKMIEKAHKIEAKYKTATKSQLRTTSKLLWQFMSDDIIEQLGL